MEHKLLISKGCLDWLVGEVEKLRKQNELMGAQLSVMDNFFSILDRVGPKRSQGYEEDRLYQAKKEIREALESGVESKK